MRPDTRSFSFTWLRGQQHQNELNLGRPTTRSQTVSRTSQNYEILESSQSTLNITKKGAKPKASTRRPVKLSEVGNSFLRNITNTGEAKYGTMEEDVIPEEIGMEEGETSEETWDTSTLKPSVSLGKRLNKTVQDVKSSLGNLSQRLRRTTFRRYRMSAESPSTPATPTRRILGRTPTKLYSPFGFDSPAQKTPKRLGTERQSTPRLLQNIGARISSASKTSKEEAKVRDVRRGFHKLMRRDVARRSVRF